MFRLFSPKGLFSSLVFSFVVLALFMAVPKTSFFIDAFKELVHSASIMKWCEKDGKGVIYSPNKPENQEYYSCGQLSASKVCGEQGDRFFSAKTSLDDKNMKCLPSFKLPKFSLAEYFQSPERPTSVASVKKPSKSEKPAAKDPMLAFPDAEKIENILSTLTQLRKEMLK